MRRPITEYAGGKGPRQLIWEAIRRLVGDGNDVFTEADIWQAIPRQARAGLQFSAIADYRRCLLAAEILRVAIPSAGRTVAAHYRLASNEGIEAPRLRRDGGRVTQGRAQEQMWRTLRLLTSGDLNARELAAHAGTPTIPVTESAARDYLQTLHKAGYLVRTKEGKGLGMGGTQARYRLDAGRNTGPRPPMVCRTQCVYDPNEDRVVWQARVTDEDAVHAR